MNAMPIENKDDAPTSSALLTLTGTDSMNLVPTDEPDDDKANERDRLTRRVCEAIVDGASLRVACDRAGVPRSTFLYWMPRHPELQAAYRQARVLQCELLIDDIVELCREARNAKSSEEASAFRLEVDAQKWRVGKMSPRLYGAVPPPDPSPLVPAAPSAPVVVIRYDSAKPLRAPAMHGEIRELTEAVEVDDE